MQVDSDKVHQRGLDINMSTPPTGTSTQPTSPTRFTTSVNAFGLSASPSSSSSSHRDGPSNLLNPETSPLSGVRQRLRRPSMLSLAHPVQPVDRTDGSEDEEEEMAENGPPRPRSTNPFDGPRWGPGFLGMAHRSESGSNLPFASLTTSTPPIPTDERMDEALPVDQSPPRWLPGHLQRRRGKLQNEEIGPGLHRPPFTGRPLPAPLLATLISETTPHEHEIQSEARLQRLISSHPRAVPFTPRTSRSSRGRFPETAGDDDDEDDFPSRRAIWAARAWTRRDSSDSDSDDMPEDAPEPVNSAFAAGMDMDRVGSSSESGYPEGSGKSTPGSNPVASVTTPQGPLGWEKSRPPRMSFSAGLAPSPGGFGLPSAFGGLGMGTGTPLGSPTIERLELATSPNGTAASPSLMQYRESSGGSASIRPGKRKAPVEDRFDPYKRPRGSSPSFSMGSFQSSPSRPSNMPVPGMPQSPLPHFSSLLTSNNGANLRQGLGRNGHPYSRPLSSRSRAASPALSIGSTSGVLSSSLGNNNRGSFSLAQAFIPTGQAAQGVREMGQQGQQGGLGGLGLLTLHKDGNRVIREEEEGSSRPSSAGADRMDED